MFEHFVITRFNLKFLNYYHNDKNGKTTQTEDWLENRFQLFDKFCFPSLTGQTCQNFKWLVLFDINTPLIFKSRIETYQNQYSNFRPLYVEPTDTELLDLILRNAITSMSNKETQYIITSRIDNDDAFHINMIKDVQSFFQDKTEGFLNYNYGIQYDLSRSCATKILYKNNHFISRIEKNDEHIKTVLSIDHTQIESESKVFSINNRRKPMWIEVIHENNLSNYMQINKPIFNSSYFEQFNLEIPIDLKVTTKFLSSYLKKNIYEGLALFFTKIGCYNFFKRAIKISK